MEGAAGAFGAALGFTLFKFLQMAGRRFPTILGAWCGSATDMNSYNALMAWLGPWCCSRGHRTWCTLRRCHGAPSCDHPAIFGLILTTYRYMYNHMLYSIVTWYMFWIISYIYIYIYTSRDRGIIWATACYGEFQPRNRGGSLGTVILLKLHKLIIHNLVLSTLGFQLIYHPQWNWWYWGA